MTRALDTAPPRSAGRLFDVKLFIGVLVVAGLLVISLFTGVYDIAGAAYGAEMFLITRAPRTVALVLAEVAMTMAGLVMQLLTQNRFFEPTTTSTTEWAGLGLLAVMVLVPQPSIPLWMAGAILAAFVGTMVFFVFLRRVSLRSSLIVPIVGIMLGAVSSYLALVISSLQAIGVWLAGSFASVLRGQHEML